MGRLRLTDEDARGKLMMYDHFDGKEADAMIYLDHAATTALRADVLEQMLPYMQGSFANASGTYAAARRNRSAIDGARAQVAHAIGADPEEIYFTSGGTEANNWAIFGAARAYPQRRHIITSGVEHHAVLHVCEALADDGYSVDYLHVDTDACVSPEEVRSLVREDTLLVTVMLANNEVGTIEPVRQISGCIRKRDMLMHTDAVQAVGHIPVNVRDLGVDMLSMSAHKFGGPKGIGALYIRSGVRLGHLMYGGAQERGMRPGTENTAAIVGMGAAIELSVKEMALRANQVAAMRDEMQRMLMAIPGITVHAGNAERLPGHLHVSIAGVDSQMLLMRLDMAGIACSAGSACTSGAVERSHVIKAMGLAHENEADLRFSIGENNHMEECSSVVDALRRILKR